MTSSKTKLLLGSKAEYTGFGLRGCSHGMYSGGFNFYVFGIAGLIALTHYKAWGGFCHDNPNLK